MNRCQSALRTWLESLTRFYENHHGFSQYLFFGLLLLLYQSIRAVSIADKSTAFANSRLVMKWERAGFLFFEAPLQKMFLPWESLVVALNQFYVYAHLPVTAMFLLWIYSRRRENYCFVRNAFVLANLLALCGYFYFPVAPPRMFPEEGFVDTLKVMSGLDLYEGNQEYLNPYAALPSMHFGYALMVGVGIIRLHRNLLVRLLAADYVLLALLSILVTGNHFVVDGIAGGVTVALGFGGAWGFVGYPRLDRKPFGGITVPAPPGAELGPYAVDARAPAPAPGRQ